MTQDVQSQHGAPHPYAVVCEGVGRRLGRRWVLGRVDLKVRATGVVWICGANGAGKTTLLSMLATATRPHRGQMAFFGKTTSRYAWPIAGEIRRHIAWLGHRSRFYPRLNAKENLELVMQLLGHTGQSMGKEITAHLHRVGLGQAMHKEVGQFSAGMQRRLGLAWVLLQKPKLALLDEPFAQLDTDGVALAQEIVCELGEKSAVVLTTHQSDLGQAVGDACYMLCDGILR